MGTEERPGLTRILGRARDGDEQAKDELIALVYDELRRVATHLMRRKQRNHTLSPTAVVHEAVIRLLGEEVFDRAADRNYLFASAARAMREVLIDHAHAAPPAVVGEASGESRSIWWQTTLKTRD